MTHIMNSIGSAFYISFTELNAFIIYFSQVFFMGVVWKRSQIGLAMAPCANHWNSWFSAAIYNSRHFSFYRQFFFRQKCIKNKPELEKNIKTLIILQIIHFGETYNILWLTSNVSFSAIIIFEVPKKDKKKLKSCVFNYVFLLCGRSISVSGKALRNIWNLNIHRSNWHKLLMTNAKWCCKPPPQLEDLQINLASNKDLCEDVCAAHSQFLLS